MTDELKQWEYDRGYEKGKTDVLDKIKAEIVNVIDCKEPACKAQDNFDGGLQVALQIIDKYRNEVNHETDN